MTRYTLRHTPWLVLAVVLGLAVTTADGATLTGSGATATVTAAVKPSRLPKQGLAPVTLELSGSLSTPPGTQRSSTESMELQLDRQLHSIVMGLGTCSVGALRNRIPAEARGSCGDALIGTGTMSGETAFPAATSFRSLLLFFHGQGSHILLYAYNPDPFNRSAAVVQAGSGHVLQLPLRVFSANFQFHIGRTWRHNGQRFSYLSGRCAHSPLRNLFTLTLTTGEALTGTVPAACTGRP